MPLSLADQISRLTAKYKDDGELVTTLQLSDSPLGHWYKSGRRMGNTTRQADYAIQLLFQGKVVLCLDHHREGTHSDANRLLLRIVLGRLYTEHSRIMEYLKVYKDDGIIYLQDPDKRLTNRQIDTSYL